MEVAIDVIEGAVASLDQVKVLTRKIILHVTEGKSLDFDRDDFDQRSALHQNLELIEMNAAYTNAILQLLQAQAQDEAA